MVIHLASALSTSERSSWSPGWIQPIVNVPHPNCANNSQSGSKAPQKLHPLPSVFFESPGRTNSSSRYRSPLKPTWNTYIYIYIYMYVQMYSQANGGFLRTEIARDVSQSTRLPSLWHPPDGVTWSCSRSTWLTLKGEPIINF